MKTQPKHYIDAKEEIKEMDSYNIDKLNDIAVKYGIDLMTINFWWNAIKN